MSRLMFTTFLFCLLQFSARGQSKSRVPDPVLFESISALDSAFFAAYNSCNVSAMDSLLREDLEFYHDQGGKMDKQAVLEATRKNVCGKVQRELIKETLEVFPIAGFGAIQSGSHRFKNLAEGDKEFGKPARFLHIWKLQAGSWKLFRIISYDH